ncbi:hypothetical protein CPB83DRAFT_100126 [Crepidotus variabilis]|uniref:Uncharacterized protein n=1 Tax=Crepidotus variabilis TaxID=179855 RepID=A0A9P6JRY2_9AGAR|nr:hypothetical protein CPB83DRAFT_100126 [Crepidotus variabilis]
MTSMRPGLIAVPVFHSWPPGRCCNVCLSILAGDRCLRLSLPGQRRFGSFQNIFPIVVILGVISDFTQRPSFELTNHPKSPFCWSFRPFGTHLKVPLGIFLVVPKSNPK